MNSTRTLSKTPASLTAGDVVLIEGCPFADPDRDPSTPRSAIVGHVVQETPQVTVVTYIGLDAVGYPTAALVTVAPAPAGIAA